MSNMLMLLSLCLFLMSCIVEILLSKYLKESIATMELNMELYGFKGG
jgi:hypothetical protein